MRQDSVLTYIVRDNANMIRSCHRATLKLEAAITGEAAPRNLISMMQDQVDISRLYNNLQLGTSRELPLQVGSTLIWDNFNIPELRSGDSVGLSIASDQSLFPLFRITNGAIANVDRSRSVPINWSELFTSEDVLQQDGDPGDFRIVYNVSDISAIETTLLTFNTITPDKEGYYAFNFIIEVKTSPDSPSFWLSVDPLLKISTGG